MLRLAIACALFICGISLASAQSPTDKGGRDDVASVRSDDPAMVAAMRKARAELKAFLSLAEAPQPDMRNFSVKVGLPLGDGLHEYIWIRPFTRDGDNFVGRVVNTPVNFPKLAYGDRLTFATKDIVDWSYFKGDRKRGNYTACALIAHEAPRQRDAFMKQYGLDCTD